MSAACSCPTQRRHFSGSLAESSRTFVQEQLCEHESIQSGQQLQVHKLKSRMNRGLCLLLRSRNLRVQKHVCISAGRVCPKPYTLPKCTALVYSQLLFTEVRQLPVRNKKMHSWGCNKREDLTTAQRISARHQPAGGVTVDASSGFGAAAATRRAVAVMPVCLLQICDSASLRSFGSLWWLLVPSTWPWLMLGVLTLSFALEATFQA